jgi:dienelactone hydrolase
MRILLILACLFCLCRLCGPAEAYEQVKIPSANGELPGVLYRPDKTSGPVPAVIALHGCGGLGTHKNPIGMRFAAWGKRLSAAGFAVLFPDSFSGRGLGSQCKVKKRKVRANRERIADADAALAWLAKQPGIDPQHISLLGWSNGATATLATVRSSPRPHPQPDFRSAAALYPGCGLLLRSAWSSRVPTLILLGGADDWTPARTCEAMVANARDRSARVLVKVYPGAYHDFDRPKYPVRLRAGVANSANGSGRVHLGTNPAARADALKRVPEWLKQ